VTELWRHGNRHAWLALHVAAPSWRGQVPGGLAISCVELSRRR